ncbi:MAG: hypothetical protein H7A51_07725 [Akkermansiaceae bacterium]|nr:hypothetical protein [Akkermansiaceae bacterium]
MLDQCTIFNIGDRVRIKPELLTQNDCLLDDWLQCQRRGRDFTPKHAPGEEGLRYHSNFEVFADRALVVHTRSRPSETPDQSEQYVNKIEINLRKILHGQNGISINNDKNLCAAILIARHAMSHLLVKPEQASELIPGLRYNEHSYWRKVEIALDVHDPGYVILDQMKYMKSPYIRNSALPYPNSTHLNGTNLELKAYDKVKKVEKRFSKKKHSITSSSDEITRLEVIFPEGKIPNGFPVHRETIRLAKFASHQRMTGFTWEDLRAIHRTYFKGIKGVYHVKAEKGSSYTTGQATAWAAVAKNHSIPTSEIRAALEKYGGKSKDTSRGIEKKMLEFMAQTSELDADTILSDEAYENPPIIDVSGLEGCRFYVEHYGIEEIYKNADEVFAVYSNQQIPARFTPMVTDDEYWL